MSTGTVVINYGAPRSGTTFMRDLLGKLGAGIFTFKLAEGRLNHPCRSENGLAELHMTLRLKKVVLIRTKRHPMSVVESFIALRDPTLWKKGAKPINVAKFSDEKIVRFIRTESENTARQREGLLDPTYVHHGLEFIEVNYENLQDARSRNTFAGLLSRCLPSPDANFKRLVKGLESFGEHDEASGPGRLKASYELRIDAKSREWFRKQLSDVIKREGYA